MTSNKEKPVKKSSKVKKAAQVTKAVAEVARTPQTPVMAAAKSRVRVGEKHFLDRLSEKLTHFDANMILEAAMLTAGVQRQEGLFKKDEAKEICLALINRGGPAYSVGAFIYREVVG